MDRRLSSLMRVTLRSRGCKYYFPTDNKFGGQFGHDLVPPVHGARPRGLVPPYADAPSRSLQLTEARARFGQLSVTSYDVSLDLATSVEQFGSVTTIRFASAGGPTFVDLKPASVNRVELNGRPVDVDGVDRGRLPITTVAGSNVLVVDAVMRFRNDGEGLHRSIDPADNLHYVYGMSFMDAAPSIFACFDQPDLKAPYTFHVLAPRDWTVIGNAPGEQVEPGSGNPSRRCRSRHTS